MNRKFALTLLSSPALFASMVSMVVMEPARANQVFNQGNLVCMQSPHSAQHKIVCERRQAHKPGTVSAKDTVIAQAQPNQITELKFSDEESDRAIALFGCDCPACINSMRQLNGMAEMAV